MAYSNYNPDEQARFDRFVVALTELSRTHGVFLHVCGGIAMASDVADFKDGYYYTGNDGDLLPMWPEHDPAPAGTHG